MPQPLRDKIVSVIQEINSTTNLCLREKTSAETDYVTFVEDPSILSRGHSDIGKLGGEQFIRFKLKHQTISKFHIRHEILHAAGFIHEHCRSDRDDYIEVLTENIEPERLPDFDKDPFSRNQTPYDFTSIMHYTSTDGGKKRQNGSRKTTLRPRNPHDVINQSNTLTALDIAGVNALYRNTGSCNDRAKQIKSIRINESGTFGTPVENWTVSSGWTAAQPILINGVTKFILFLNAASSYAIARPVAANGTFSGEPAYEKQWGYGWRDIETMELGNTTFILHQKRYTSAGIVMPDEGLVRIAKVNAGHPFQGHELGDKVYEEIWVPGGISLNSFL